MEEGKGKALEKLERNAIGIQSTLFFPLNGK